MTSFRFFKKKKTPLIKKFKFAIVFEDAWDTIGTGLFIKREANERNTKNNQHWILNWSKIVLL